MTFVQLQICNAYCNIHSQAKSEKNQHFVKLKCPWKGMTTGDNAPEMRMMMLTHTQSLARTLSRSLSKGTQNNKQKKTTTTVPRQNAMDQTGYRHNLLCLLLMLPGDDDDDVDAAAWLTGDCDDDNDGGAGGGGCTKWTTSQTICVDSECTFKWQIKNISMLADAADHSPSVTSARNSWQNELFSQLPGCEVWRNVLKLANCVVVRNRSKYACVRPHGWTHFQR